MAVTAIPTAGISVPRPGGGNRQIINYMSVRSWGTAGNWVTNFSAIAYSDDNGQTWTTDPGTVLVNAPVTLALPDGWPQASTNNAKFQQSAYFRGHRGSGDPGENGTTSGDDGDYIYQMGTPNGRFGAAYLARFRPSEVLSLSEYEYWAGSALGWVDDINRIPSDGSAKVVDQPVTELSIAWSPYLGKYLMLDGDNGIRLRTADRPQGPWSGPTTVVSRGYPVLYAPMMLSNSPALTGDSKDLYFNASRWSDYNVMLLRTDLSRLGLS